jgi:sugar phosphate isomerase/epimerase
MFLSMHNWMRAEPIEVTIRRLAKYGYESIEIGGEPGKYNTQEIGKVLKENKVRCWGSVTLMFPGLDLIAADPAIREKTVQYCKDCIRMVRELDGCELTIVPSTVGKVVPQASPEEEWAWCVEGLKEVYAFSETQGIALALEPLNRFETNFLNRAEQAVALATAVGLNCGVCLDAFHINIEEADFYQAILNTGKRLIDFHIADNNRMHAGGGDYNWAKLVKTLDEAGYKNALTVEFVAALDRTPVNRYPDALASADPSLTPEQLKFIQDHGSGVLSENFYSWMVDETAKTMRKAMKKAGVAETKVPKQVKVGKAGKGFANIKTGF